MLALERLAQDSCKPGCLLEYAAQLLQDRASGTGLELDLITDRPAQQHTRPARGTGCYFPWLPADSRPRYHPLNDTEPFSCLSRL
jgi:hypothetical protein